ncbi:hypothetical protein D3C86_2132620 [compost metagenome]
MESITITFLVLSVRDVIGVFTSGYKLNYNIKRFIPQKIKVQSLILLYVGTRLNYDSNAKPADNDSNKHLS